MQFSPGNASSRDFQLGQVYKNPAWNDTKQHLLASPIIKIQSALVDAIFFSLCNTISPAFVAHSLED